MDQTHSRALRRRLRGALAAGVAVLVAATAAAAQPPASPGVVQGDSLRTTRWHIASYLYLLNYGRYEQAGSEANIDYAARLGFNAVRFNLWWHEIFPDATSIKAGGNWSGLDHNVDYAIGKGLKVILTVCLRRPVGDGSVFTSGDCVVDSEGRVDSNWDKTTRMSFSSPRFGRAIRFFQQVGERYRDRQNAGHILAIAPLVTREAEIAYAHEKTEDFNPAFVAEFRSWLAGRYDRRIAALNAAWGREHAAFDQVRPPQTFSGPAGHDWYRFRDLKARQFVDSCCAALAALPGVARPYRVLLDYGNVGDPMSWRRGSISFAFHAANPMVWGIKHNDAHEYDQRYTGSLLGANALRLDRAAFNEWFYDRDKARYPGGDVVEDSCKEIQGHFDQGMNGVSYVGVHPPNKDLESIVQRLKQRGVWTAPVAKRLPDPGGAVRVKLSTLLDLHGWQVREKYFDPHFRAGRTQADVLIDRDFTEPLLPIVPPQDYGDRP